MPEGVGYPGSNVVAGAGKELNYVGNHAYAYSGAISIDVGSSADHTMLNFTSGAHVIRGFISWFSEATTTADEFIVIKLNGVIIVQSAYSHAYYSSGDQPIEIIIPPYTNVECLFGSHSATTATLQLTGRVFE